MFFAAVAENPIITKATYKRDKKEKSSSSATDKSKSSKHESMMEDQRMLLLKVDEEQAKLGEDPHDRKSDYTYAELLDRVMLILHANNPDLIEKKRRNMKPPECRVHRHRMSMYR